MTVDSKKEAMRKKSLGELGELFAIKALVDDYFERIVNLNDMQKRMVINTSSVLKQGTSTKKIIR